MKQGLLVVVSAALCSGACVQQRPILVVPDSSLAGISAGERTQVDAMAVLLRAAKDARVSRKSALTSVEREVQMAGLAIQRDKAAVNIAELQFQAAQETANADAMLPANKARQDAGAQLDRSTATRKYLETQRDYQQQLVRVGDAEIAVAGAKLELTKYVALTQARGYPNEEKLAEFKSQVAGAEADLAEVQVLAAKAEATMSAMRPVL